MMNNPKTNGAEWEAVYWAVYGDVDWAVDWAVNGAVYVSDVVSDVADVAVFRAVRWAVDEDPPHPHLLDFLQEVR